MEIKMCKYIVISGGVVSGIGKGISAASIGLLMRMRGERVQVIKFDPYLNISASLLSPFQHGEVFLCDDGSETDLDLGHYERITGIEVSHKNICTNGSLFSGIFNDEVEGKFMGQTVQIVPHVTDKIQDRLKELGESADIVIAEIGGTVGDFESGHFYEAIRQFKQKMGESNFLLIHVAPVLWMETIKELKTKPLQNSIRELQRFGLQPDVLLCRTDKGRELPKKMLEKISHLTSVPLDAIFDAPDVQSVYQVPVCFYDRHIDDLIADKFKLKRNGVRIHKWRELVERYVGEPDMQEVNIGIIGKYAKMPDAYMSLKEAIYHAGVANSARVNIHWIEAEKLEEYATFRGLHKFFENIHCVIVPGGFDNRGIEGKIKAIQYVREKKIPFLGICLGLQCAVIEFARNVCGIAKATSEEFITDTEKVNPTTELVVHYVDGQQGLKKKGGTLRLGAYDCSLMKNSIAHNTYKKKLVSERHRHRYEVNGKYTSVFINNGFLISGTNPGSDLIEIMELDKNIHPFFIGCQFHPEFKSRLDSPHPLFESLIDQAMTYKGKPPTVINEPVLNNDITARSEKKD
jgi:CTP synthase